MRQRARSLSVEGGRGASCLRMHQPTSGGEKGGGVRAAPALRMRTCALRAPQRSTEQGAARGSCGAGNEASGPPSCGRRCYALGLRFRGDVGGGAGRGQCLGWALPLRIRGGGLGRPAVLLLAVKSLAA